MESGEGRNLEAEAFQSEEVFRLERERLFRRHWLCLGREDQLIRPGCFRRCEVEGQSLLLVAESSGRLRCFFNVCRHRGATLLTESEGRCDGFLRCSYHGWRYGLDGQLQSAPNMRDAEGFSAADLGLVEVSLARWQGFVMVQLGPEPVAFADAYEPVLRHFDPWSLAELQCGVELRYEVRANWKLLFQNYSECYHCPHVHPILNTLSPPQSAENDLLEGSFCGGPMALREGVESMSSSGLACAPTLPDLDALQRRQVFYYTLFPTMFISPHPDYVMVHYLDRRRPDETLVRCQLLFHPDAMERADFDPQPAAEFWDEVNRQDWEVCERCQQGSESWGYRVGPISSQESVVRHFNEYYREQMAVP